MVAEDRISSLPESLIHHILSLLPTIDVFRMRSVSRRWKTMWLQIPVLNFQEFGIQNLQRTTETGTRMFMAFVDNCFDLRIRKRRYRRRRRLLPSFNYIHKFNIKVARFKLYVDGNNISANEQKIQCWLNEVVAEPSLKELDIRVKLPYHIRLFTEIYLLLTQSVLSNSMLTTLRLEGVRFDANNVVVVSLPCLKTLSLIDMNLEEDTLQTLFSGCPIIEHLHLSGFKEFKCGVVDVTVCGRLKSVALCQLGTISDEWLERLVLGLPLLEWLTIDYCWGLRRFSIYSQSLRTLCFFGENHDMEATLNTPGLVHFNFRGDASLIFSINSVSLLQANLKLWGTTSNRVFCFNLILFLSNLHCSSLTTMRLYVLSQENLIIPRNVREICGSPLPELKRLKVKIKSDDECNIRSGLKDVELKDSLQWCAPSLETLQIEYAGTSYYF